MQNLKIAVLAFVMLLCMNVSAFAVTSNEGQLTASEADGEQVLSPTASGTELSQELLSEESGNEQIDGSETEQKDDSGAEDEQENESGLEPGPEQTPVPSLPAVSFDDVNSSDWCYEAVQWAVSQEITMGTTDTTFSPNEICSRAEIITFIWRANGSPEPYDINANYQVLSDINRNAYYFKALQWAVEQGIIENGNYKWNPDWGCIRSLAVTYLWRAAGQPVVSVVTNFTDVSQELLNAVNWAYSEGITSGTSATTFSPNDSCTRAQIMTFLYRAYGD